MLYPDRHNFYFFSSLYGSFIEMWNHPLWLCLSREMKGEPVWSGRLCWGWALEGCSQRPWCCRVSSLVARHIQSPCDIHLIWVTWQQHVPHSLVSCSSRRRGVSGRRLKKHPRQERRWTKCWLRDTSKGLQSKFRLSYLVIELGQHCLTHAPMNDGKIITWPES